MPAYGFVYVLSNISMPGLVKVGATERSPHARAAELSSATGVPTDFMIEMYVEVTDPFEVEADFHSAFADERFDPRREFFSTNLMEAAYWLDRHSNLLSAYYGASVEPRLFAYKAARMHEVAIVERYNEET